MPCVTPTRAAWDALNPRPRRCNPPSADSTYDRPTHARPLHARQSVRIEVRRGHAAANLNHVIARKRSGHTSSHRHRRHRPVRLAICLTARLTGTGRKTVLFGSLPCIITRPSHRTRSDIEQRDDDIRTDSQLARFPRRSRSFLGEVGADWWRLASRINRLRILRECTRLW